MYKLEILKNPEKIDYIKWMNLVNKETQNQSDRALVLLCAAILDEQLEFILKSFLVEDDKIQEKIFDNNAPLSTFNSKNNFCFYLGLISKHEYNTINTIRKIRNKFAHEILINSFEDDASIKGLCDNLSIPTGMYVPDVLIVENNHIQNLDEEPLKGKTSKERFVTTFKYITQYLYCRFIDIFPIKREEYVAKTQAKLQEEIFQELVDSNKKVIELMKKELELLNEEKELYQKNNIIFTDEQQLKIDEIIKKINDYETNPFSISGDSMLKIDYKDYLKIINMIKNDLKESENIN